MMQWMPLLLPIALLSAPVAAADVAPAPSEHRLSPAEIEKVLDAAARGREARESTIERAEPRNPGLPVHGEVGFEVGTGGYRSAFGTAVIELPSDGVAIISFETSDFDTPRRHGESRER